MTARAMNIAHVLDLQIVPCEDAGHYAEIAAEALTEKPGMTLLPILGGATDAARLCALLPGSSTFPLAPKRSSKAPLAQLSALATAETGSVLVTEIDTPEALPAAFYAAATGRRLILVEDLSIYREVLVDAEDAMIAAPASRFSKRWLAELLDWAQTDTRSPGSLGLLTGRSAEHLSEIVVKLLAAKVRHAEGRFFQGPEVGSAPDEDPEFVLIGAHGNEIHLGFGEDSTLCGRRADVTPDINDFDCGRCCPIVNRIDAASITATTVFLMSCDGFTPADGLAPQDFSLLFRLLDGNTAAVLAPFKHIQANEPLVILIEAMARTGYPIGEIAHILNARTNGGALPDPGFLVLGDPALCVVARDGPVIGSVSATETPRGLVLRGDLGNGCRAVTLTVQQPDDAGALAVMPMTENMRADRCYFTLGVGTGGQMDVTLFRDGEFAEGQTEVALMPAARVADDALRNGAVSLDRVHLIKAVFGTDAKLEQAILDLRGLLVAGAAFPRPIEAISFQQTLLQFDAAWNQRLAVLRAAAADQALAALAKKRVWISQEYTEFFPDVRRAGPERDHLCPYCGNGAVVWRYTDRVTDRTPRDLSICNRCGIIADVPISFRVVAQMDGVGTATSSKTPIEVNLTNRGDRACGVSLALQVNEFESADVTATSGRVDLELAPGECSTHRVELTFPKGFQDDILSIQLFLIDDDMELSFFSQKVRAAIRDEVSTFPSG